jgi:hypothetical protein
MSAAIWRREEDQLSWYECGMRMRLASPKKGTDYSLAFANTVQQRSLRGDGCQQDSVLCMAKRWRVNPIMLPNAVVCQAPSIPPGPRGAEEKKRSRKTFRYGLLLLLVACEGKLLLLYS